MAKAPTKKTAAKPAAPRTAAGKVAAKPAVKPLVKAGTPKPSTKKAAPAVVLRADKTIRKVDRASVIKPRPAKPKEVKAEEPAFPFPPPPPPPPETPAPQIFELPAFIRNMAAIQQGMDEQLRRAQAADDAREEAEELERVKKLRGRPTTFNRDTFDTVCMEIAEGRSLISICAKDGYPAMSTFLKWTTFSENENFKDREDCHGLSEQYAQALELRNDAWREELSLTTEKIRVARKRKHTYSEKDGGKSETEEYESVEALKIRRDSLVWLLSKLQPKRYGNSVNADGDSNNVRLHGGLPETPTDEEPVIVGPSAPDAPDTGLPNVGLTYN